MMPHLQDATHPPLPFHALQKVGAGSTAPNSRPPATALDDAMQRLRQTAPPTLDATSSHGSSPENLRHFLELFNHRQVHAVFQPILDLRSRRFLGHEGLIRGPVDSPLHSPQVLFSMAQEAGLTVEFERICRETVLRQFSQLGLHGRLFLNVSVGCLADPRFINGDTSRLLNDLGLRPGQIVLEITENQQVTDFAAMHEVLASYRKQGYQIAIDDLGEGFSNLRLWSEIRPEFVKIDQHFIRGIADDPLKFRLVQAMRDIAESCHAELIAEGIETESEFITVRDLGIAFGQGYLIARPALNPDELPTPAVNELMNRGHVIVFPQLIAPPAATVRQLLQIVTPLTPQMLNDQVFERFESHPEHIVLPVVLEDGTPHGLINRYSLIDRFARPFRREIYGKRLCTQFMNADPILVDQAMPVQELGQLLGRADHHQLVDGFVITENGRYLGIGSSQALMSLITDMQIQAARYANPLTQLPGNVPINEHIDRLLDNEVEFVACYCDLDFFKPYNDIYGYRKGDQLIQLLASLLDQQCDARLDFIGHVGGDDFILLMQSADWEQRCHSILTAFEAATGSLVTPEHHRLGGYFAEDRRGNQVFQPLPSLSIGALVVEALHFHSHHEVSGAMGGAKKEAKKLPGNSLFIERRRPFDRTV